MNAWTPRKVAELRWKCAWSHVATET